jgi:MFS family permease
MPPALLLAFTFALGAGVALQLPGWQAIIPELVHRPQLRAATRLEMASVNLARSAGPTLAGPVIAHLGVPVVFALNAVSVVFLAVALLLWRQSAAGSEGRRARFVPARRGGGRYVWHEPVVRRILLSPGRVSYCSEPLVDGGDGQGGFHERGPVSVRLRPAGQFQGGRTGPAPGRRTRSLRRNRHRRHPWTVAPSQEGRGRPGGPRTDRPAPEPTGRSGPG